jgi:hypothetical protein
MKIRNQIYLLSLACLTLSGCSHVQPVIIDENINYPQKINLTGNGYSRLSYLLE